MNGNVSGQGQILLPPRDMGMPQKFSSWRKNQEEAILEFIDSNHRFLAQCAPTGSGKSVIYTTCATLSKGRSVILTSTKALQKQLLDDFSEIGMVEIKGKNSYRCVQDKFGRGCDYGDCNFGVACGAMNKGCHYYDALRRARESALIVTNYSYWLHMNFHSQGLFPHSSADLLVLDEAHHADHHLVDLLTFHIRQKEIEGILNMTAPRSMSYMGSWVKEAETRVDEDYKAMVWNLKEKKPVETDELHDLDVLQNKLKFLSQHWNDPDWMVELDRGIKLCPIWPREHADKALFAGAGKVLLTSATIRPKTVEMLGLKPVPGKGDDMTKAEILKAWIEASPGKREECLFSDYPSIFNPNSMLLIHVPTVRMNYRTSKEDTEVWLKRIDQIIATRLHQKGIIHTVSYDRADRIVGHSEYSDVMLSHASGDVIETVERFKKASPPCILVSPSVMTGFDFPHDLCRWMIIGKIPFPDTRDRLTKARMKKDPEYGAYLAMQSLVQASGRGTRAPNDYCVSFLLDDSAFWFMKNYRHFAPRWFMDGYRVSNLMPQA